MLPDLGFVEGCCDARQSCLNLLPYVGRGWCPKVSLAAMLDLGVCRWDHIVLGISAQSHVDAATLRRALERMDAAWPEGEERMAKLSVCDIGAGATTFMPGHFDMVGPAGRTEHSRALTTRPRRLLEGDP